MHHTRNRLNLLLTFLVLISLTSAETLKMRIEGTPKRSDSNEIIARRDANGRFCSAIQVVSKLEGLAYDANNGVVGDIDRLPGMDRIYLQPDERVLKVYASGYEPLKIILSEYGIYLNPKEQWTINITGDVLRKEVNIVILTTPVGAEVRLDDKSMGTGNSYIVKSGSHELKLTKTGYQPISETISVDEKHTLFKYELKEIEDVALQIFTTPDSATVYVDNLKIGITPASEFFPAGRYPIHIEKEWYVTYEDSIDITPPGTKKTYTLQPDFATLEVSTAPEKGLEIYLNDRGSAEISPHTFARLVPGEYKVSARSQYYEATEEAVRLVRGDNKKIRLKTEENFATLTINSYKYASVTFNGKPIAQNTELRFEPQVATIEVRVPKAETLTKKLTLKKGESKTLDLYPEIQTGTLQVVVKPLDANIELTGDDGEHFTSEGMYNFKDIPVGSYTMTVSLVGFETKTETLNLAEGDTIKRNITLEERKAPELLEGMVFIKGGSFEMGCGILSDDCNGNERPVHAVTVSDFYMSATEVTQKQWTELMDSNPSSSRADDLPVDGVSWNDVQEFLRKLNLKTGGSYRLPTEAEWEYAARGGGEKIKWAGTGSAEELGKYAWYAENSDGKTRPVGTKKPNKLGLYDMSGNVWEWCNDRYGAHYYKKSTSTDPKGPDYGTTRVIRGGAWNNYQKDVRCTSRFSLLAVSRPYFLGFRLAHRP